ncbi:uncharacterized protein LOC116266382 isoform X2 [Nymphaea colorata]|uniref:uncharacterized protein LOC116266382 isoform X2 n=1 Tax=Nymphaea colorata TaxID=210225 RepID=UPI00129E9DAB|nr:uncharacterized protein LOC116266382 isoform X2 [Nymphaea colorata]
MVRLIHCCVAVSWASRRLLLPSPPLAVQAYPLSLQSCCRRRITVSLPRHALCFSAGPLADEPLQESISFKPTKRDALESGLYLVATPIGNLEDITLRALRVLKSANLILSEDTRHSGKLLQHYNIKTPLLSYHKFNESQRGTLILQKLQQGEIIALISDAGTPGISDPGEQLTKLCVHNKIPVFPIPGPCAVIAALSASGLSTDEFTFVGFLSKHAGSRRQRLLISSSEAATQIFYVPPHKIQAFLDEVTEIFSTSRNCVIAREMTKVHEEFWRGTLGEAKEAFSSYQPKGEITILVEGKRDSAAEVPSEAEIAHELRELVSNGHSLSMAVKMVSESTTVKRKSVYSLALKIFGDKTELPKQVSSEKD